MLPYMTPERFRIGGWGADLDGIEPAELRAILFRATAMVNEYCTVPQGPQPHDFRGGTITGEEIDWQVGNEMVAGQYRVYPKHTPLIDVTNFQIDVTNGQYVGFTANELYVTDDYFEIVSAGLTSYGLFGYAVIPTIGLIQPVGVVDYTYGRRLTVVNEILEATDARLYRAMNQWWFTTPAPSVYKNGALQSTGYSLDYDEGTVLFSTAPASTDVISVNYEYKLPPAIAEATGMIATELLGDRSLTRKGLHGLVELAVGEVRIRRDFPRAGVQKHGVSDKVMQLLDPYKFAYARGS